MVLDHNCSEGGGGRKGKTVVEEAPTLGQESSFSPDMVLNPTLLKDLCWIIYLTPKVLDSYVPIPSPTDTSY